MATRSPYGYAMQYTPTPRKKKPVTGALTQADWAKAANFGYSPIAAPPPPGAVAAPVFQPVAAAGGGPAASVWDPNAYLNQLRGDPLYGSALETFGNALASARTGLRGSIQEAVIRSGFDPSSKLTGDLAGYAADIDEGTKQAAASNQLSQRALLEQQLNRGMTNLDYTLAARGGLRSGMSAAGQGALTQQNQVQVNDAMSQLGDAIRGGITGYQGVESQLMSQRDAAIEAIAQRLAQQQGPAPDYEDPTQAAPAAPAGGGAAPSAPATVDGSLYGYANSYTPSGVQWGGQTFTSRAALSRYLGARGQNFATWAANHPEAAGRLS